MLQVRQARPQSRRLNTAEYGNIEELLSRLKGDAKKATITFETSENVPQIDGKLARLSEAKRALLERWKERRYLRPIRKKDSFTKQVN